MIRSRLGVYPPGASGAVFANTRFIDTCQGAFEGRPELEDLPAEVLFERIGGNGGFFHDYSMYIYIHTYMSKPKPTKHTHPPAQTQSLPPLLPPLRSNSSLAQLLTA